MNRIQFYPDAALFKILKTEAESKGVSISQFVNDLLEDLYETNASTISITQLTEMVLKEIEEYVKQANSNIVFDLYTASETYRNVDMTCGKKPSTVRASIGRRFSTMVGKEPFGNIRKYIVNGTQKLSANNALVYEVVIKDGGINK